MKTVYRYDDDKKYVGTQECQIDPLETQEAGHDVYLMPANCTEIAPPEPKDGFDIIFNGDGWEYVKQPEPETPKPYEPTELDLLRQELWEIEQWFDKHEYIGTKIATGRGTREEYADEIAEMSNKAKRVDELRAQIAALENQDSADNQ